MRRSSIIGNRRYSISNLKYSYDSLNDLLYVYKEGSQVYSTVVVGEFHLEINKIKELVGLEILNASELLAEYDIPKRILKNIDNVEMKVVVRNNSFLVFLIIHALNQEKLATITMNNLESPIMQAIASA